MNNITNYQMHKQINRQDDYNGIQNIKMQKIISQIPELTPYLTRIPKNQHNDAIKHLIRLGLEATQSYCCKQNRMDDSNVLRKEIDRIKGNIEELNQMVKHQYPHYCHCYQKTETNYNQQPFFQTQPTFNNQKNLHDKQQSYPQFKRAPQERPVKDNSELALGTINQNTTVNPFAKNKGVISRHHLDDSAAREALTFPASTFIQSKPRTKRRSQQYKKHIYQQQINRQDLGKIKQERGESLDGHRKDRTVSDYSKATSKIKALLDQDRIRYTQNKRDYQFKEGFNKYEYSDQNQMEESSMQQESLAKGVNEGQARFSDENTYGQHFQSGFKASNQASSSQKSRNKTSSKKEFERSKKEVSSKLEGSLGQELRQEQHSKHSSHGGSQKYYYRQNQSGNNRNVELQLEEDDDVVSNSSSFSQFSINGSRRKEVGKISRRSHND